MNMSEINFPASAAGLTSPIKIPLFQGSAKSTIKAYTEFLESTPANKDQDHHLSAIWITPESQAETSATIGVLGGMGPLASAEFLDQYHTTNPNNASLTINLTTIPDRATILLNPDPRQKASDTEYVCKRLTAATNWLIETANPKQIVMPCNTAHGLNCHQNFPRFVDMIKATHKYIEAEKIPNLVLLGTKGTRETGIYQTLPTKLILPDAEYQDKVMKVINGIKEHAKVTEEIATIMTELIAHYQKQNATHFLLGCTEIPLAIHHPKVKEITTPSTSFIDPMQALIRALK